MRLLMTRLIVPKNDLALSVTSSIDHQIGKSGNLLNRGVANLGVDNISLSIAFASRMSRHELVLAANQVLSTSAQGLLRVQGEC